MALVLLDTDMLSEIVKLRNQVVVKRALEYTQNSGPLTFSAFTRYEVLRGYKRQGAAKQLARFAVFCQKSLILPVSDGIWDRASDLWALARTHGYPHNDADLVIAATALDQKRRLATGNTRHFAWIPGLQIDDWRMP